MLAGVLVLVLAFAAVEWLAGSLSHSLALRSDAGHMLTDGAAIALALVASWVGRLTLLHPAVGQGRLETIAALVNGLALMAMAGLISWEAWRHFQAPPTALLSGPMLATALVGLGVNGVGLGLLYRERGSNLNLRGAFLHVLADLLSSVGVIVAAVAIALFHWVWLDGAISVAIAGMIAVSALPLVRQSWRQLRSPATLAQAGFLQVGSTRLEDMISRS